MSKTWDTYIFLRLSNFNLWICVELVKVTEKIKNYYLPKIFQLLGFSKETSQIHGETKNRRNTVTQMDPLQFRTVFDHLERKWDKWQLSFQLRNFLYSITVSKKAPSFK